MKALRDRDTMAGTVDRSVPIYLFSHERLVHGGRNLYSVLPHVLLFYHMWNKYNWAPLWASWSGKIRNLNYKFTQICYKWCFLEVSIKITSFALANFTLLTKLQIVQQTSTIYLYGSRLDPFKSHTQTSIQDEMSECKEYRMAYYCIVRVSPISFTIRSLVTN